jgi:hypothetical protein
MFGKPFVINAFNKISPTRSCCYLFLTLAKIKAKKIENNFNYFFISS